MLATKRLDASWLCVCVGLAQVVVKSCRAVEALVQMMYDYERYVLLSLTRLLASVEGYGALDVCRRPSEASVAVTCSHACLTVCRGEGT